MRARRFIAAGRKDWLYPEAQEAIPWSAIQKVLLPPENELWHFGGEIYIGHNDGTSSYRDAFGRTTPAHKYLAKEAPSSPIKENDPCGCASGRKFKNCCQGIPESDRPSWKVLSIRERNLILCRAVHDILGFNDGKTWNDVRRELSDEQVKRIHEVFEFGWPPDTDISELLPRPDNKIVRSVYLGLADPRTVSAMVTSWLCYFDEIIVACPFTNPNGVRPEYSPTKSPGKFKEQTLKSVMFLLMIEPYIRAGTVIMIPDPAEFNDTFRREMWGMAEQRAGEKKAEDEDVGPLRALAKDDHARMTRSLPFEALQRMVQRVDPDLTLEQARKATEFLKEQEQFDSLALLQPRALGEEGAQYMIRKGFNLELALFLAAFTGSAIHTDVKLHWKHLHEHASAARDPARETWQPLIDRVRGLDFFLDDDSSTGIRFWIDRKLEDVRRALREVMRVARKQSHAASASRREIKELVGNFHRTRKNIRREWEAPSQQNEQHQRYQGTLSLSAPQSGFGRNEVHRLLLMYARARNTQRVPLAFFVEVEEL